VVAHHEGHEGLLLMGPELDATARAPVEERVEAVLAGERLASVELEGELPQLPELLGGDDL
jgi:hypothetical protein